MVRTKKVSYDFGKSPAACSSSCVL